MLAVAPIRVVLMGSGVFALPTLAELRKTGKNIVAVYTKPPKPAGRGHRLESTPVQKAAEHAKLLVRTPRTWYDCNTVREFSTLCADVAVVVDYGVILPKAVLDVPHWGCFNLHPSLLPRWRGSAPVQRAIAAGDEKIGLSIALLEETVDAGPIAVQQSWSMPTNMTASEVLRFLSEQGAKALCRTLDALSREGGKCDLHVQSAEGVCMAGKLTRAEGRIDWSKSAEQLERQVRAFHPWPGSWFLWRNQRVLLLSCRVAGSSGPFGMPPGMFHGEDLIACGRGSLQLLSLRSAGGRSVSMRAWRCGHPLVRGSILQ